MPHLESQRFNGFQDYGYKRWAWISSSHGQTWTVAAAFNQVNNNYGNYIF